MTFRILAALAIVMPACPALATAQAAQADRARIHGIVTTRDGRPLADAAVTLRGSLAATRTMDDGRFVLEVAPGTWWVVARRIGYASDSALAIVAAGLEHDAIRLVLVPAPQALRAITVESSSGPLEGASVSPATMRNVPPLGEADVFRTLVLLPGVSQPNDLKGSIHLAGAGADETGVRLDGHPLQQPFHVFGALGAFNVASLDEATARIHQLPIQLGGSLGGVVDLKTRGARPDYNHEVDVSIASGSATIVSDRLPGGSQLLMSGRMTYLNRIAEAIHFGASSGDEPALLGYSDWLVKLRVPTGAPGALELIGFQTMDRREVGSGPSANPMHWGEYLAGAKWVGNIGALSVAMRADENTSLAHYRPPVTLHSSDLMDISQRVQELELVVGHTGANWQSLVGVTNERRQYVHRWNAAGATNPLLSTRTPANFDHAGALAATTGFGQLTRGGSRTRASVGTRVMSLKGRTYLAPRASVERELGPNIRASAAAERRLQNTSYLEEPKEGSILQPSYLLDVPKRADVVSLGVTWRGDRVTASERDASAPPSLDLTVFARSFPDRPVLRDDPRAYFWAQEPLPADFPRFDRIHARAAGASVSMLGGLPFQSVAQLSYTYQRVIERIDGVDAPAPWDAPHALTAYVSTVIRRSWSLSAVGQFHSGVATTPIVARVFAPASGTDNLFLRSRYLEGARNSARLPAYARIDLAARRTWKRPSGTEWSAVAQLINAYGRDNVMAYDWNQYFCYKAGACRSPGAAQKGLPVIPSLGVEVRW